jgi:hypothetical protein
MLTAQDQIGQFRTFHHSEVQLPGRIRPLVRKFTTASCCASFDAIRNKEQGNHHRKELGISAIAAPSANVNLRTSSTPTWPHTAANHLLVVTREQAR